MRPIEIAAIPLVGVVVVVLAGIADMSTIQTAASAACIGSVVGLALRISRRPPH
jgi:drug/metabolite transporter (DMT)-like permease